MIEMFDGVKSSPLKTGFIVSILCHGVALGLVLVSQTTLRPPAVEPKEPLITFTLVAAPDEPAILETKSAPVIAPPPPVISTSPVEVKPAENSLPVEPVKELAATVPLPSPEPTPKITTQSVSTVVASIKPELPMAVRGDGSSLNPGKDATSTEKEAGVKVKPSYLKNPDPPYPVVARRRHQEGLVILTVSVTAAGNASEVRVKKSSQFPLLDEAAMRAVRDWEFEPARIGLTPVSSEIEVPIRFQLTP